MGFPVLSRVFSSSSSRLRGPASHAPVNPGVGRGTGMRKVEGKTLLCPGGCFGVGGGRHASKVGHQTVSRENQGKKNKPFAVIRRFLRRKSKSSSTNVLLADEDIDADEARVPAAGSHDAGAVIGSVDTDISGLEILTVAEKIDRETAVKSLPSFSSTEIHTTITCDDKEGDHDWMVSPIFQSFRFECSGEDGASTSKILLMEDKLDIISLADASSMFSSDGKEGSQESTVSPILNSARLTSGSVKGADTREILSEIPTLEDEEETMGHSLDNGSLSESRSTITSIDEELDGETRVTLETLMAMENLLPEERNDRGVEGEFEVRDCVSGSVCCSPLVCLSNMQGGMTVELSSGSTFFAHPDALFPPSPHRLSSPSGSTVTSVDEAVDEEMTAISEMLMSMETLLPCDGEVEEFGIRDRVSGLVSRSPFICWSNRQGRMTVEPSSGSSFFAHPDTLFPPSPLMLSSPSLCSPSSVCSERNRSKDNGAENTWIVSVSRTPDADKGENTSNSPRNHYSPRNQWTVASTSKSEDWESRVTVEMLMSLENLVSEETSSGEVEIELGARDCISRPISRSPLVCWSH